MSVRLSLQDIPIPTLKEVFEAMKGNSHVEVLSIAATRSNDPVAYVRSTFSHLPQTRFRGHL